MPDIESTEAGIEKRMAALARRRAAYAALPAEEKARRQAANKRRRAERIALETPEQRELRLSAGRERSRVNRQNETPALRDKRLEYFRRYKKPYSEANKDRIKASAKAYYAKNKQRLLSSAAAYRAKYGPEIQKRRREAMRANPQRSVTTRLRHRLYLALRIANAGKQSKTMHIIGCSRQFLIAWIELQFTDGMSWENSGSWHIDHIIPCSAFDMCDEGQQRVAFHYTNLRPLWAGENIAKRDRVPITRRNVWTIDCVLEARGVLGLPSPCELLREIAAA